MIETSGVDKIISLLAVVLHTRDIKYKVLNMFASYLTTLYTQLQHLHLLSLLLLLLASPEENITRI